MKIKFIKSELWKAGIFLFLGILFAVEVYYYPNLDTVLTKQGYETGILLGWFFALNYLMNATRLSKS